MDECNCLMNLCQKKNYIILNFNYPIVNTFLIIFLNQKVGSIINSIRKSLYRSCLQHFEKKKKNIFNKGQSLTTNWFIVSLLQPTTWQLIRSSMCILVT